MKHFFLFVSVIGLVGAGCAGSGVRTPVSPVSVVSPPSVSAFQAVPGQKFGEMAFDRIDASNTAFFTGKVLLHGEHKTSELDGNICFYPDASSSEKIPNLRKDPDDPTKKAKSWFCFSNHDQARRLLGTKDGTATILIDGFQDLTIDTSQPAFSEFVRVVTRK